MRFLKSELSSLLSTRDTPLAARHIQAADRTASAAPCPSPSPEPAGPPGAGLAPSLLEGNGGSADAGEPGRPAQSGPAPNVIAVLRSAAPRLWARATSEQATRRLQRERFLELLAWLLSKNGYQQLRPARQDYFEHGKVIEGRLALLAQRDGERLAIELCLDPTLASAYKLLAARKAGAQAVMLCGFAGATAEAHEAITRLAGRSTEHWFTAVCLSPKSKGPL